MDEQLILILSFVSVVSLILVTRTIVRRRKRRLIHQARSKLRQIRLAVRSSEPRVRVQVRTWAKELTQTVADAGLTLVEIGTSTQGLNRHIRDAEDYAETTTPRGKQHSAIYIDPATWRFDGNPHETGDPELEVNRQAAQAAQAELDTIEIELELPPAIQAEEAFRRQINGFIDETLAETDDDPDASLYRRVYSCSRNRPADPDLKWRQPRPYPFATGLRW